VQPSQLRRGRRHQYPRRTRPAGSGGRAHSAPVPLVTFRDLNVREIGEG
jgi:hypothetical protein